MPDSASTSARHEVARENFSATESREICRYRGRFASIFDCLYDAFAKPGMKHSLAPTESRASLGRCNIVERRTIDDTFAGTQNFAPVQRRPMRLPPVHRQGPRGFEFDIPFVGLASAVIRTVFEFENVFWHLIEKQAAAQVPGLAKECALRCMIDG